MPDEEGHVTHFTVPALPWKEAADGMTQEMRDDCLSDEAIAKHIDQAIQHLVEED